MMNKNFFLKLTGIVLLLFLFNCNEDYLSNEQNDEHSEHQHKHPLSATYSEVLKTTSFTSNTISSKAKSFYDDYIESDFEMDTAKIVKTLDAEGNAVAFAIYMKKKNETESDVFYNLVLGKKVKGWERFLLKYSPVYEKNTETELHWNIEILTSESYVARGCTSTVSSISTFNCPAGHTDPNCWDCAGCWDTDIFTFNNPCTFLTDFSDDINGVYSGGSNSNYVLPASQAINNMLYHIGRNFSLSTAQLNFLQSSPSIASGLQSYLSNNQNTNGAQFVIWGINFLMQNSGITGVTWFEFSNWFINGYSDSFRTKVQQLSSSELQDYKTINREVLYSPYNEENIIETNEAFVAFTAYADVETITEMQMQTVLNQCCPSIIIVPQGFALEKSKMIAANYRFNRKFYPEWSKAKCLWEASRETFQLLLDLGGLVPVIGEVCDITNGVIYTVQGDGINASLSFASAIPFAGWFASGTKFGVKVVNASDLASRQMLKWIVGTDGYIKFGYSNQLRKVLKLTDKTKQAHHIIPWAYNIQTHHIVQKAAKSSSAFHLNEALNGIAVASWRNQPNHNAYNTRILNKLNALPTNLTADQAYNHLVAILNQAKQAIINNPNTHLNDLVF